METEPDLPAIRVPVSDLRVNLFTETELAAAELLVQLSESANSGDSSCSTTSSPRSVNTCLDPSGGGNDEVVLSRRKKRYRMISDLYNSTTSIGGGEEEEKRKTRKRARGEEEEEGRGVAML